MQSHEVIQNLNNLLPNSLKDLDFFKSDPNFWHQIQNLSGLIHSSSLPQSISQMQIICRKQQKEVMDQLIESKGIDIYNILEQVCPENKNLRNMPIQQVSTRIRQMTTQMLLEQNASYGQEEEISQYSAQEKTFQQEMNDQLMDMDYFQYDEIELSNKRHNMFEDDKNTNFLSNQVNPFYFN